MQEGTQPSGCAALSPCDAVAHKRDVPPGQALAGLLAGQAAQAAVHRLPKQVPSACVPKPARQRATSVVSAQDPRQEFSSDCSRSVSSPQTVWAQLSVSRWKPMASWTYVASGASCRASAKPMRICCVRSARRGADGSCRAVCETCLRHNVELLGSVGLPQCSVLTEVALLLRCNACQGRVVTSGLSHP